MGPPSGPPRTMISVDEVSGSDGLEALREAWGDLQSGSPAPNVFLTFEWALAWWRHLGAGRRLRVLALREDDRVCGILPLCEGPVSRRFGSLRRIQILGTGLSDRLDFLVNRDPTEVVQRALTHLVESPASWQVLDLREIPEQSPTVAALRAACGRLGLACEVAPDSESPYLTVDSDWETFFATRFGRERRQQMRRKARRLEARAQPTFSIIESIHDHPEALDRIIAVRQHANYRGEELNSIFSSAAKRAFFKEVADSFSRRGWLHIGVLELGGDTAAFRFSFKHAGMYYDYYHGYDQGFAAHSPGQVLLSHVMQDCYRRGFREIDLLRGAEPWKAVWTDRRRRHVRVRVFRPGVRGSILRLLFRAQGLRTGTNGA